MATVAAATEAVTSLSMDELLDRMQLEQFRHDELYHREISRLSTQARLKHMALHFAKYAGNLAEGGADPVTFKRIVTDVFIIAMTTANTLNVRLADEIYAGPSEGSFDVDPLEAMSRALVINAGKMATACEKLDHLEDFPFRPVIKAAAVAVLRASLEVCRTRSWAIRDLVAARLQPIKGKSIFYGKL